MIWIFLDELIGGVRCAKWIVRRGLTDWFGARYAPQIPVPSSIENSSFRLFMFVDAAARLRKQQI